MATDNEDLELSDSNIDKLAGAISKGIAATARKQVTVGELRRRRPIPKLKYKVYQNGFYILPKKFTQEQADLINRITRPGRYINRMVEVALWGDGDEINLDLRYTNNTPDTRFELKNHFRNFNELVQKIVDEQDIIIAKQKRTQSAVEKLMAQNDAEAAADEVEDEPRIEATAKTPKEEARAKKAKAAPFSSARIRKAQAEAGL